MNKFSGFGDISFAIKNFESFGFSKLAPNWIDPNPGGGPRTGVVAAIGTVITFSARFDIKLRDDFELAKIGDTNYSMYIVPALFLQPGLSDSLTDNGIPNRPYYYAQFYGETMSSSSFIDDNFQSLTFPNDIRLNLIDNDKSWSLTRLNSSQDIVDNKIIQFELKGSFILSEDMLTYLNTGLLNNRRLLYNSTDDAYNNDLDPSNLGLVLKESVYTDDNRVFRLKCLLNAYPKGTNTSTNWTAFNVDELCSCRYFNRDPMNNAPQLIKNPVFKYYLGDNGTVQINGLSITDDTYVVFECDRVDNNIKIDNYATAWLIRQDNNENDDVFWANQKGAFAAVVLGADLPGNVNQPLSLPYLDYQKNLKPIIVTSSSPPSEVSPNHFTVTFNIDKNFLVDGAKYKIIVVVYYTYANSSPNSLWHSYSFINEKTLKAEYQLPVCIPPCRGYFEDYITNLNSEYISCSPEERMKADCVWSSKEYNLCREGTGITLIGAATKIEVKIFKFDGNANIRYIMESDISYKNDSTALWSSNLGRIEVFYDTTDPNDTKLLVKYAYRVRYEDYLPPQSIENLNTNNIVYGNSADVGLSIFHNQDWTNFDMGVEFKLTLSGKITYTDSTGINKTYNYDDVFIKFTKFKVIPYDDTCLDIEFFDADGVPLKFLCEEDGLVKVCVTNCEDDPDYLISGVEKDKYGLATIKEFESFGPLLTIPQLTEAPVVQMDSNFSNTGLNYKACGFVDVSQFPNAIKHRFVAIKKKYVPPFTGCTTSGATSTGSFIIKDDNYQLGVNSGKVIYVFMPYSLPDGFKLLQDSTLIYETKSFTPSQFEDLNSQSIKSTYKNISNVDTSNPVNCTIDFLNTFLDPNQAAQNEWKALRCLCANNLANPFLGYLDNDIDNLPHFVNSFRVGYYDYVGNGVDNLNLRALVYPGIALNVTFNDGVCLTGWNYGISCPQKVKSVCPVNYTFDQDNAEHGSGSKFRMVILDLGNDPGTVNFSLTAEMTAGIIGQLNINAGAPDLSELTNCTIDIDFYMIPNSVNTDGTEYDYLPISLGPNTTSGPNQSPHNDRSYGNTALADRLHAKGLNATSWLVLKDSVLLGPEAGINGALSGSIPANYSDSGGPHTFTGSFQYPGLSTGIYSNFPYVIAVIHPAFVYSHLLDLPQKFELTVECPVVQPPVNLPCKYYTERINLFDLGPSANLNTDNVLPNQWIPFIVESYKTDYPIAYTVSYNNSIIYASSNTNIDGTDNSLLDTDIKEYIKDNLINLDTNRVPIQLTDNGCSTGNIINGIEYSSVRNAFYDKDISYVNNTPGFFYGLRGGIKKHTVADSQLFFNTFPAYYEWNKPAEFNTAADCVTYWHARCTATCPIVPVPLIKGGSSVTVNKSNYIDSFSATPPRHLFNLYQLGNTIGNAVSGIIEYRLIASSPAISLGGAQLYNVDYNFNGNPYATINVDFYYVPEKIGVNQELNVNYEFQLLHTEVIDYNDGLQFGELRCANVKDCFILGADPINMSSNPALANVATNPGYENFTTNGNISPISLDVTRTFNISNSTILKMKSDFQNVVALIRTSNASEFFYLPNQFSLEVKLI